MRLLWRCWGLVLAVWATGASGVEVPVIENAGYTLCTQEAKDAMTLGRLVMAFKESRTKIEAQSALSSYTRSMADDFFRAHEAGKIPTYVHFAQERFKACLRDQQVKLEVTDLQMFACLSRLDIPFYFYIMQHAGKSVPDATVRVEKELKGWHYPPGLVARLAEPAMEARDINDVAELQFFLLNSCLLPTEEVHRFYGIPSSGGGTAATVMQK